MPRLVWMLRDPAPVASSLCVRYTHQGLLAFSGMALGFLGLNMVWMYAMTGFLQVPLSYSLGINKPWTESLLPILAMVDFAGKLLCGWYANLHITQTVHLLTMTITLTSASLMLLPLANSYLSLTILTGFYGFFFGATVAIHITVLADVVGMPDFDSALGLFMLIRSTGGFVGPPLASLIMDMAGDYRAGFYMAGATLVLSAGFLITLDHLQQRKEGGSHTNTKPEKSTLLYPSLHFLKLQKRRYQEHGAVV